MNQKPATYSYVIETADKTPLHLRDRAPFVLPNTEAIFRFPEKDVIESDGRVLMAGAIEFQSQITPGVLTDVCDPDELYKPEMRATHRVRSVYDPEIQRGVKETTSGAKEFLRPSQIEAMKADIDGNKFECPQLMWNLRAGETVWVYVRDIRELRIYEGVATRPDTNHRHHAIVGVQRRYLQWIRETDSKEMGTYNPLRSYGLVIYTDDFQGEARRFYTYNFKGWRVATSTAHYIESKTSSPNLHARLARELMDRSSVLGAANVEILSNHLSRNSAKMVTFGTMVDALKAGFPNLTEDSYGEVLPFLIEYFDALGSVRPGEVALMSVAKRQRVRELTVADQAVLWHGYIRAAARLKIERPEIWREALAVLAQPYIYTKGLTQWTGDVFSRDNPVWFDCEVMVPGRNGPRVVNNRQSRQGAFELLCELAGVSPRAEVVGAGEPDSKPVDSRPTTRRGRSAEERLRFELEKLGYESDKIEELLRKKQTTAEAPA